MTVNALSSNYQGIDSLFTGHEKKVEEKKDPLGREAFLTMLVAQLRHQDPLNPMEGTDFTAQLAQFSTLEQQFTTNDSLEAILNALNAKNDENLIDFIGKNVQGEANTLIMKNGNVSGGSYTVEDDAEVMIAVYNSEGFEIRSIFEGQKGQGTYQVNWDGKDNSGREVLDGTYTYEVVAVNELGGLVSSSTAIEGLVNGVIAKDGRQYLEVDDRLLDPNTVTRVWMPPEDDSGSDAEEE